MRPNNKLTTIKHAAELLAVTPQTIRDWVRQGILPAFKIGSPGNIDLMNRDRRPVRLKEIDVLNLIEPVGKTNNRILDTNF